MLQRLRVKNFKAWRELDMELGRVTAVFGTNSSGKSSILHFLLMLKQTASASDRDLVLDFGGGPSELVHLGSYETVLHRGLASDAARELTWLLRWSPYLGKGANRPSQPRRSHRLREVEHSVKVGQASGDQNLAVKRLEYQDKGRHGWHLALLQTSDGDEYRLEVNESSPPWLPGSEQDVPALERPVKTHLLPDMMPASAWELGRRRTGRTGGTKRISDAAFEKFRTGRREHYRSERFARDSAAEYERLMRHLCYLGPLRQHPRRYYTWTGAGRDGVGDSGQFTIDAILKATQRGEGQGHTEDEKGPSFQERVAFWLKRLGLVTSFDVRRIAPGEARPGHRDPDGRGGSNLYEAVVEIVPEGPRATLSDVGFGISQVLPVLVLLYYVPKGSMLLLEQPELHLHPSAQSSLADAILAAAIDRELQVLVESHSEHFLRRLQRRVAEGTTLDTSVHPKEMKVHPEDVKVYFVSSANGSAHLQDLRLNRYGGVENWPEHFFGDEMGEIAAIHKARLRRQHGGAPT